jgi:hypothetical protein
MKKHFFSQTLLLISLLFVQTTQAQWNLTGNSLTSPLVNFVGTIDANPLVLRTSNMEALRISATQNVGIGLSTPTYKLDVTNTNTLRTLNLNNTNTTSSTKYGIYNNVSNAGTGGRYGIYNVTSSASASSLTNYGFYNSVSHPGTGTAYGIYSTVSGGSGNRYGIYSSASGTNAYSLYAAGRVYVSDKLGIGEAQPVAKLQLVALDLSLTSPGSFVIGSTGSTNIGMDNNEIQARNDSTAADLFLQNDGGSVIINGTGDVYDLSLSSNGALVIGSTAMGNMTMDVNEIQARNNGASNALYLNKDGGNVYIGTSSGSEKLNVCGGIQAKEVRVESGWCDYVFAEDYHLPSLDEVSAFIEKNNHLPKIPPATVVESEGLSLGQMSRSMMEKIEELTLYLIDQHQQLKAQGEQLLALQQQNDNLTKQLNGMK